MKKAEEWFKKGCDAYNNCNYVEAIKCLKKAIVIKQDYPGAHYSLGLAYASRGALDFAVAEYKRALALNQDIADAYYRLGLTLDVLGKPKEAKEIFEGYLRLENHVRSNKKESIEWATLRIKKLTPHIKIINEKNERQLCILIGNDYESNLGFCESLFYILKPMTKDKYRLKCLSSDYAPVLSDLAKAYEFDIFFPYVNNIFFPSDNKPPMKRIGKTLQFITHFKKTYEKPIIASYGYPDDPSFSEKLQQAGADFAIRTPWKVKDLLMPIEKCLNEIA